jgi:hypothetical protein
VTLQERSTVSWEKEGCRQKLKFQLSGPVLVQQGKGRKEEGATKKEGRKVWKRMKRKLGQVVVVVVVRRCCGRRRWNENERGGGGGGKEREKKKESGSGRGSKPALQHPMVPTFLPPIQFDTRV